MKTTKHNQFKNYTLKICVVAALLLVTAFSSNAQSYRKYLKRHTYVGMIGGFGVRSFTVDSDIKQINNLFTSKVGGNLGIIYGTSSVKFPLTVGMYYQSIEEKRTIDLFSVEGGANVSILHLLGFKKAKLDVYTVSTVDFQSYSFMGTYVDLPEGMSRKMIMGEPLLGKVSSINANLGAGIEYRIREDFNFIHLFAEIKKVVPLTGSSSYAFSNTTVTNNVAVNFGLRIGTLR